ncbi:dna primase [hydrocarbon metagenome]|uniref:Dna primase n=1 Tax=hydrocarbon metagenome TaxID=938273 RepID=A0A0W8E7I7_9ZZZZ
MTRYYDDQILNDIMNRLDIVDIVSESVKLTRKGNRYWGLCPFHEEKTSSFSVTPDKNLFYCFGCHAGGNIFTYIMKRDGLEFGEAVEMLASRAGIQIAVSSKNQKTDRVRKSVLEINQAAAQYYHQALLSDQVALDYMVRRRGINRQTIEEFKIGYAADAWNNLEEYLLKKGYPEQYLKTSGLIKRSSTDRYYDLFRNRIVFPISQYSGEIVGFGGRVIDEGMPKYLNTPETELYSKRKNLYGLYQAREAVRKENEVLLVEGYMDCIKIHQNGIKNCAASLGTAFTSEQAVLLRRYAEKVIILYDGDEAGQRETMRAIDILRDQELNVEVITLPGDKDPDEYLELYGKEEFLHYIKNNKVTYLEFKINRYINQEKQMNLDGQKKIISSVKMDIKGLTSEIEKDYYIKTLAKKLQLEENIVYREISSKNRDNRPVEENKSKKYWDNIEYGNYSLEEKILASMLKNKQVFSKIKSSIGIDFFTKPDYREFIFQYDLMQNLQQMTDNADEAMMAIIARIEFMLEDIGEIDDITIDNFIRRVNLMKAKKRQRIIYHKLSTLNTEGDFNSLMKFILEMDTILNKTREGGI